MRRMAASVGASVASTAEKKVGAQEVSSFRRWEKFSCLPGRLQVANGLDGAEHRTVGLLATSAVAFWPVVEGQHAAA